MKKYLLSPLLLATYSALLALLFLPLPANASAIEQLKIFLTHTHSARGDFAQLQVHQDKDGNFRPGAPATGTFLFSRPGKFIWNYQKPYEQILQSDGKKLYIYDKDLNQVTARTLDIALGSNPAAILFGNMDIEKKFTLAENGIRDNLAWVEVTPKEKDGIFQRINIGMKDNLPVALELRDALGQISLIKFTKMERNPTIKANAFQFIIPKGTDVFSD
jgi:outer membrane lipoprotein carrier protein